MTSTTHQGPVQTGKRTGAAATTTIGTLIATQVATVANTTSGASSIVLPANSKILDWQAEVLVSASGNAGGMLIRVGSTSDGTQFGRSEEHTSELQSLMRISYAVFCLKKKKKNTTKHKKMIRTTYQ